MLFVELPDVRMANGKESVTSGRVCKEDGWDGGGRLGGGIGEVGVCVGSVGDELEEVMGDGMGLGRARDGEVGGTDRDWASGGGQGRRHGGW